MKLLEKEYGKFYFEEEDDEAKKKAAAEADDEKDVEYWKAESAKWETEAKTAFSRRDRALTGKRNAERKVVETEEKMDGMITSEELDEMKAKYKEMEKEFATMKEKQEEEDLTKIEDEKERERVRLQKEHKKEMDDLNEEIGKMKTTISTFDDERKQHNRKLEAFRVLGLENEIITAADKYKAYNPRQIVTLTKGDFKYDDKLDTWIHDVFDKKGNLTNEFTVEEYVKAFLENPDNENLLRADAIGGSGADRKKDTNRRSTGALDKEPTDVMYKWADSNGLNINPKSDKERRAWLVKTFEKAHTFQKRSTKQKSE
jgi:hypothetical protein